MRIANLAQIFVIIVLLKMLFSGWDAMGASMCCLFAIYYYGENILNKLDKK